MRKITLLIHITEHDDGAKFYEWDMRGAERGEAQEILKAIGEDLKSGPMVVLKEEKGMVARDIGEVLEKIIREVPDSFDNAAGFKGSLKGIIQAAKYSAPEAMQQHWNRAANMLERYLGDPDEEWKRRIASIFAGRSSI